MTKIDKKVPRRWRKNIWPEETLFGREREYLYGCYFPSSDLNVNEGGRPGTGEPQDVEWLDGKYD